MTGEAHRLIDYLKTQNPGELFDLTPHKERRTRTQNAYYWVLVSKMADKLRESKNRVHNTLLRSYGRPLYIGGQLVTTYIPDTEEAENIALEAETFHIKPTSQIKTGQKGQTLRTYILLKGSSDYDTAEMSALVDGAVIEAQGMGIETLTPAELESMRLNEKHNQ